ncbi:MAG: hypothetical protein RLZ51_483 [Pseudomonadota bacterium]|jgi:hypothetical protein
MTRSIRIGGASGFWGDTASAAPQLVEHGNIDYLVFDYLAEVTMSIMAAQKAKDPSAGYATDFVQITMKSLLPKLKEKGIRVVSNAGGVNPQACREALARVAESLGIALKIGVVMGDDLSDRVEALRSEGVTEMYSGAPMPARFASMNAYLGAIPIARALDEGCDVVITGRCVDSAVTLGVMMHAFGWQSSDYDKLAQGTLGGHLIECGAQCCGGLFTDWETVPDWDNIGFPVLEASPDGSFVVTKPPGTGGLVTPATVCEQLLYEIGDPRAYHVPDVACDFTQVKFEQVGEHRVRVTGARGQAPTATYKVSSTYPDGFRNIALLVIAGDQAAGKARRTGEALMARIERMAAQQGLPPLTEKRIEVVGAEDMFGADARPDAREVVLKMAARSPSKATLDLFAREFAPAGTSMSPGITGFGSGRPTPSPVIRLFSFLIDKSRLRVTIEIDGQPREVDIPTQGGFSESRLPAARVHLSAALQTSETLQGEGRTVPLIRLAHGRSGDKGDKANVGIVARRPEWLPLLSAWLTPERVQAWFAHNGPSRVERFDLPGFDAMNFLIHDTLGGGGMASLRTDNLAKCFAQVLLAMPVPAPEGVEV